MLDQPPEAFITYLQNHDQVANTGSGRRLHQRTSPARLRALTALMLLMPGTPMLFQGQEFAASSPFLYFADMGKELRLPIANGRAEFLKQFPAIASPQMQHRLIAPDDPDTRAGRAGLGRRGAGAGCLPASLRSRTRRASAAG